MANYLTGIFDNIEEKTLRDNKRLNLNHLVGLNQFKKAMESIARMSEYRRSKTNKEKFFPYHFIFTIEEGMGLTTVIKSFTNQLYDWAIIEKDNYIEYKGSLSFEKNSKNDSYPEIFYKGSNGLYQVDQDYGVIAVNISEQIGDPQFKFEKFLDLLWEARGNVIFILIINGIHSIEDKNLLNKIKSRLNCYHIDFPPYTNEELVEIARKLFESHDMELARSSENKLKEIIIQEREKGSIKNVKNLVMLVERIKLEKISNISSDKKSSISLIDAQDFIYIPSHGESYHSTALNDLDDFIGLESVKKKLIEIVAHAKVQKIKRELGHNTEDMCYHMMFTGNPGTGKTTIARILGKMFKEAGILKKGDVHEVSRDSLVGKYVGYTAQIVRDRVKDAMGSILFIDEAYSLYGGDDKRDYGYEAIDTLVRVMENKRSDIVIIMAGYPQEMEDMLKMNSGLRGRIPFKIEFPDYNASELLKIFLKVMGEYYVLSEEISAKIHNIFEKTIANKSTSFSNGRLARNIAERLKLKHSMRICRDNIFDRDALINITDEDIEELLKDEDIKKSICSNPKEKIGF